MRNELLAKQSEELLKTLKSRFEKNLNRHKDIEWAKVQAKLKAKAEKLCSLYEMEQTGGEPDVVGFDKKRENIFFMIAQRKAQKGAEVFVTTMKRWRQGKKINQVIAPLTWQLTWALRF